MTDKLRFTRSQIRSAAIVAKDEGVSIRLETDGSLHISPAMPDNNNAKPIEKKPIVRF